MSSDLPNKRQRQTGSFSPASPPYHLAKPSEPIKTTINQQPNTPTSPPYMSSTTQSQSHASFSSTQDPGLTPPSPVAASTTSQPNTANTNTFPTPASSAEMLSFSSKNSDGNARVADAQIEDAENVTAGDIIMGGESDHRQTGHDRQGAGSSVSEGVGSNRLSAGSGPFYKLCETPYPMSRPHASQNLVSAYGLDRITQSVARFDPLTGEKINKLRKSYEGHIKGFQIAGGKNKPEPAEGQLNGLLDWPDEEWYSQRVFGKELEKGVGSLLEKLNRAVKMNPGKLPGDEASKWKARIGTDDGPSKRPASDALADPLAKKFKPTAQTPGQVRTPAVPSPGLKPARPDRLGKKRSYVESSFKGYGEGYADDDPMGESTGGEDEGRGAGLKKKRRKDFAAGSPLAFNERRGSYQPGMVGVRH